MPTMTSALFVRRLSSGNDPARGPVAMGKNQAASTDKFADLPTAFSKGVDTGHLTSPVSLAEGRSKSSLDLENLKVAYFR
jgi:hypothetical protein